MVEYRAREAKSCLCGEREAKSRMRSGRARCNVIERIDTSSATYLITAVNGASSGTLTLQPNQHEGDRSSGAAVQR